MGNRPKQTFFQIRHSDGQQVHEKMLNITNYLGNTNHNHNKISPLTCQNGYYQKDKEITSVGKDVEKREPSCTAVGNVNWCNHYGKHYGDSLKIKNITTVHDPEIPFLGIYLNKTKTLI